MAQRDEDLKLLHRLVDEMRRHEGSEGLIPILVDGHLKNFEDILDRMEKWRIRELSPKQRSYAKSITEKVFDEPQYSNDWSEGRVPRGSYNKSPVPAVLQKPLPLKPPGR
jgi:hypothetical protein